MEIFKFGGSILQDAKSLQRACAIVNSELQNNNNSDLRITLVISAFAKTTSKLNQACEEFRDINDIAKTLYSLCDFHISCLEGLKPTYYNKALENINRIFLQITDTLSAIEVLGADEFPSHHNLNANLKHEKRSQLYNEIVTKGEYLASKIIYYYFLNNGIKCQWLEAANFIKTDGQFNVDDNLTRKCIKKVFAKATEKIIITQGFVSSNKDTNVIETLGKEGSDYSATILGSFLDASKIVLWKDVNGIMDADPYYFKNTNQYSILSYDNMKTISQLGATVIHPNTLKPLKNKNIPLYVRSFNDMNKPGTLILKDAPLPNPYFVYFSKKCFFFIKIIFWQNYDLDFFKILFDNEGIIIDEASDHFITLKLDDSNLGKVKDSIDRCWYAYKNHHTKILS